MRNRKEQMSLQEETYLCHLISQERLTPKQQLLFEAAQQLYGKKVKELSAKTDTNFEAGASVLNKKTLSHFRKHMEHCHFSKLTGKDVFDFLTQLVLYHCRGLQLVYSVRSYYSKL